MTIVNPCLQCGACCAHFRASFYWAEADDATPEGVPTELTDLLFGLRRVMKGTEKIPPRCIALTGEIGGSVSCAIHPRRASVCRDFEPSFENGENNPRCDEARAAHGMRPLTPEDWLLPGAPSPDKPLVPRAA